MAKGTTPQLPLNPTLEEELRLWAQGYQKLAGLDEAGRGALAGPVSAAAVILPVDKGISRRLNGVRDSKLMTSIQRQHWAAIIKENALAWAVACASNQEIDDLGIVPATRLAMLRALKALSYVPQYLLIDYIRQPVSSLPQKAIVKGDRLCLSIAAASVLAKTHRDEIMVAQDSLYPGYNFARHKGYGTLEHRRILASIGGCEIHRRSFHLKNQSPD